MRNIAKLKSDIQIGVCLSLGGTFYLLYLALTDSFEWWLFVISVASLFILLDVITTLEVRHFNKKSLMAIAETLQSYGFKTVKSKKDMLAVVKEQWVEGFDRDLDKLSKFSRMYLIMKDEDSVCIISRSDLHDIFNLYKSRLQVLVLKETEVLKNHEVVLTKGDKDLCPVSKGILAPLRFSKDVQGNLTVEEQLIFVDIELKLGQSHGLSNFVLTLMNTVLSNKVCTCKDTLKTNP